MQFLQYLPNISEAERLNGCVYEIGRVQTLANRSMRCDEFDELAIALMEFVANSVPRSKFYKDTMRAWIILGALLADSLRKGYEAEVRKSKNQTKKLRMQKSVSFQIDLIDLNTPP